MPSICHVPQEGWGQCRTGAVRMCTHRHGAGLHTCAYTAQAPFLLGPAPGRAPAPTPPGPSRHSLSFFMPLSRHLRKRQAWHCRRVFRVISQVPFRKGHLRWALLFMALLGENTSRRLAVGTGQGARPHLPFSPSLLLPRDTSHTLCGPAFASEVGKVQVGSPVFPQGWASLAPEVAVPEFTLRLCF